MMDLMSILVKCILRKLIKIYDDTVFIIGFPYELFILVKWSPRRIIHFVSKSERRDLTIFIKYFTKCW